MAKYVPSKDLEELKPRVGNIIYKLLGYSDPSLVAVIMNCITAGQDKKRMTGMGMDFFSSYDWINLQLHILIIILKREVIN